MATSIDLSEPEPISPFLRNIPSEIRNTIYSLIFQADSKDAVTPISVTHLESETGRPLRRLNIEHPLLRTCKQIRHEAAGIYYTETTFELTADSIERSAAEKVCHKLSPWADKIARLSIAHEIKPTTIDPEFAYSGRLELVVSKPKPEEELSVSVERCSIHEDGYSTVMRMCMCKVETLESRHRADSVVSWACRYAELMESRQGFDWYRVLHCWHCAGECIF